jgi:hypothetical protein
LKKKGNIKENVREGEKEFLNLFCEERTGIGTGDREVKRGMGRMGGKKREGRGSGGEGEGKGRVGKG